MSSRITTRTGWALVAASVATIAVATLLPTSDEHVATLCVICGDFGVVDALLNVVLFTPLGVGLALAGVRARPAAALIVCYTLVIESLQLSLVPGRDASLGDLIMNSFGGMSGYAIGRFRAELLWPVSATAVALGRGWLLLWACVQLVTGYSLIPVVPQPPYYLHVARAFGPQRPAFDGLVLAAAIDGEPLARWNLPNAPRLHDALARYEGAPVQLLVVHRGRHTVSEVLDVSAGAAGVFSFEQVGSNVDYAARTGADVLRLRRLAYRLPRAFLGTADRADTVRLVAQYGRKRVTLQRSGDTTVVRRFEPRLSQGWRLVSPVQTTMEGRRLETLLSVLFLAASTVPAGYWAFFAAAGTPPGTRPRWVPMLLVIAVVFVAPAASVTTFGLPRVAAWEWVALFTGVAVGHALALGAGWLRGGK